MYFHPLQEEIGNMPEAEISKRIRELTKKLATAKRWLRNPEMIAQLQNALLSYQEEMRRRRLKNWQDEYKKARGEPDMGDLINIE
jgi:chromosome segregation ATPase